MRSISRLIFAPLFLLLTACQEFQGPVWSPDGQQVAYTLYSHAPNGGVDSSVYTVNPDDETPTPKLVAEKAAFPKWTLDGTQLYFLGERDEHGFYTKLMRLPAAAEKPEIALPNLHLTGMQMAYAQGQIFLLLQGRDAQPDSPARGEIWNSADNKRTPLNTLGDMYNPALSYNGRVVVYGIKPADGHAVLMAAEINGAEPQAISPTKENSEADASSFVVHAFPDSDKYLFYGPGAANVWLMQGRIGANKFTRIPLPPGMSSPVMARIADDSKTAVLTLMHATTRKVGYEVYDLDLATNRWTKIEGESDTPIGGQTVDPKAKKHGVTRKAWLAPAGLALGEANKAPQFLPQTAAQYIAASALALKAGDAAKALELALKAQDAKPPAENSEVVNQALYVGYIAEKNFDRATDIYEQTCLTEPIGAAGLNFIFPPDSGLPQPPAEWVASELKKMNELIAGKPDNRLIPILKEAFSARLKGEQRKAMELYQKAFDLAPDKARAAGTKFLQGMCELELGEPYLAGELFDTAARTEEFPQADYAAGLGAISFLLHGKTETMTKATATLQLPAARKSPLAPELNQLSVLLKGKVFKEHGSSKESVSADGSAHTWAEHDAYWMPAASTKSAWTELADGKFANRHFGVVRYTASTIWSNKSTVPILRVARPVTQPQLAPSGNLLAFTASGEVFPLPDNFCELFVLDLKGTVYIGNAPSAAAGRTKGRQIISKFVWSGESDIKLSGVEVDVFGGQKPFEKTASASRFSATKNP